MSSWVHSRKLFPTVGGVLATPALPLTPRAWASCSGLARLGLQLLRVSEPGMDPLTRRLVVTGVAFEGEPVSCEFLATASHISFQPSCCPDID